MTRGNQDTPKAGRRMRWEGFCPGGDLFAAGLIMMIAFLLNPSTILRVPQFLLFWFYAWLSGRKTRPLIMVTVMLGIVFFNLLAPYGKVLAHLGPLVITQGSLFSGLRKALTLEGLVLLSGAVIRRDLRLPGALGDLIGESFRLLYRIPQLKGMVTRRDPIGGIDRLLLELSAEQDAGQGSAEPAQAGAARTLGGFCILAALALPVIGLSVFPEKVLLRWLGQP